MEERKQQELETLKEMRDLLDRKQSLKRKIGKIDAEVQQVHVDKSKYDTKHEVICEEEKKKEQDKIFEKYAAEEKKKKSVYIIFPIIGLAITVVAGYLWQDSPLILGAPIPAILGFVIRSIIVSPIKKKVQSEADAEYAKLNKTYEEKLKKAQEADRKEEMRYENDLNEAREKCEAENKESRAALANEKQQVEKRFNEINILGKKDLENLEELIDLMESGRADNIKEALLEMDREKRRQEEEMRRREEEERRRQAEEAARRATLPGTVHIRAGSISTSSGKLKTVQNIVYIDGAPYGASNANGTQIRLNPGPHTIYAELQEVGYVFTAPAQSFVLEGSGEVYIRIMIKNGYVYSKVCQSYSEMMTD